MFIKMRSQEIALRASKYLLTRCEWFLRREEIRLKGGFPLFAETTRSELASTRQLAKQFSVIAWVWQFNEHRPSWSFKQRQLNQPITITLRLTEHANIFLNTYPVVVFSDLSLQPLLPCTRSQQCFTTATIPSGSAILNISNCHVVVLWRGIYSLRIAN